MKLKREEELLKNPKKKGLEYLENVHHLPKRKTKREPETP